MKIAVLSDLHIFDGTLSAGTSGPSYLSTASIGLKNSTNPLSSLHELIEKQKLQVDYLVCPGDIADKASPNALQVGWSKLNDLVGRLSAKQLIATNGNHDIDSRLKESEFDAKGVIQSLDPNFPLLDLAASNSYWARNYVIQEKDGCRFLLINSAAYHGYSKEGEPPEYLHGRVSRWTVNAIARELEKCAVRDINIAIFHHHPLHHAGITYEDNSQMQGGDSLLEALAESKRGPWIIIHGHKHIPRLLYAGGGANPPLIFGAGSFSATLVGEIAQTKNQFYIVELENHAGKDGLTLCGHVQTWDWAPAAGWTPAILNSAMCARAGFGHRGPVEPIVQQIKDFMSKNSRIKLDRTAFDNEGFKKAVPALRYVLPRDFPDLEVALTSQNLNIIRDGSGEIIEIGLKDIP